MTASGGPGAVGARMHVACAARVDYVPHAATMLHSVLTRSDDVEVEVHFLHGDDWPADYFPRLEEMAESLGAEISYLHVSSDQVSGLRTRDYLPAAHWYRVFLPDLLGDLGRVLYLDGDLLALESLAALWRTPLGENYLGAVTNVFQHNHAHRPVELGLPASQGYFNSGVLLMNLERMRRDDATAAVLAWANSHWDKLAWPEQDALNVVLGDRRLELHPRWNLMNSILLFEDSVGVFGADVVREARAKPAIRHFEGPAVNKPWHYLCDRDMRDLYAAHRRQTPWPELSLEGKSVRNRVRRLARAIPRA